VNQVNRKEVEVYACWQALTEAEQEYPKQPVLDGFPENRLF